MQTHSGVKYFSQTFILLSFLLASQLSSGQFTQQDTLRGSITQGRKAWNVLKYDITVKPDFQNKTIEGKVTIIYRFSKKLSYDILAKILKGEYNMQIDLQQPLIIDSIIWNEPIWIGSHSKIKREGNRPGKAKFKREGNVAFVSLWAEADLEDSIIIFYHGKPRQAINPPWDGGWIWKKDEKGNPWMSVACQGLGASVWYPCKDHQSDEPDNGASLTIVAPDTLTAVGNGRLTNKKNNNDGTTSWTWEVKSPINNYNIIPYIGKYATWHDEYNGEKGKLDLDYWVLDYNLEKAMKQFGRDVKPMLQCFENWFGPYPFYEDGYKLVESPHLGMEHQSAVAYGNKYMNGYLGRDLSGSGWGKDWDYIIVHESGHEWFGNNITTNDIADMWVHEGFTDYSEPLFVECKYGKNAADAYCQGLRRNINNDKPVIGPYGVNKEGSGDMYAKGANLLHTIRQIIGDEKFREILRGLNKDLYHKTTTSKEVEAYFSKKSGRDLSRIFDQYLRTTKIPVLEYKINGRDIQYRWVNVVPGFSMPVKITEGDKERWIKPTTQWQKSILQAGATGFLPDRNFYIEVKKI
ncbi:MAG: M1 family metallopeptidase [Chitinophagaceae bacterium]|nr:M1 family metallopeptidase [Chitinophagaceae bacterium]